MRRIVTALAAIAALAPTLASASPWVDVPRSDRYATALPQGADDEVAPDDDVEVGIQAKATDKPGEAGAWTDAPRRKSLGTR